MKSSITRNFRKRLDRLPQSIQEQANKDYNLWRTDPYHPSLQFKRVSQKDPIYSVRVGLNYRALGLWEKDCISWFWIGTHSEYDEILKNL